MNQQDNVGDTNENLQNVGAAGGPIFTDTEAERLALYAVVKEKKEKKKGHVSFLAKKFNISRNKAADVFEKLWTHKGKEPINEVLNAMEDLPVEEPRTDTGTDDNEAVVEPVQPVQPPQPVQHVHNNGRYVYNEINDKYIVPLATFGGDFVCPGTQHRAMLTSYSNWKGSEKSLQDIARTYKMHLDWVKEYFKVMRWTHASTPITDEEVKTQDTKTIINRVLQQQKAQLTQELQTADWDQTQKDALSWRLFEAGKLDPFELAVAKYKHKSIQPLKFQFEDKESSGDVLLVGLSDLHFGAKAIADELCNGANFDAQVITDIIDEYGEKIGDTVNSRTKRFEKGVICSIGDVLHTLTGFTEKGTRLEADVLREDQFTLAYDVILRFINRMHEVLGKLDIHVVKGNHAGPSEYYLFHSIRNYFRECKDIQLNLYRSRGAMFRVKNTAVLLDHGDSEYTHAKVPNKAGAREAYIQKRLLQNPDKLAGCTSKIFIQGDMHHFEQIEFSSAEFFMFGSPVTGDRYADALGLSSRPRQNCLVIGEDGVKEVLHYYFDR